MPSIPLPGSTFTFSIPLVSQSDSHVFQASATIATGDFKRSINGGAFANMDNLPAVTPAAGKLVQIVVSAAETTAAGEGGTIDIVGSDAAGAEWDDISIAIRVGVIAANAAQISGDATAADNAEAFFDGTGYAGTNNTIPTVTTLTNMPAAAPSASDNATAAAAAILVTPANKLATGAAGVASVNVTYSVGEELASRLATKAEMDAALAALAGGVTLTVSSPVAENGDTELYAGDDYNNSDGRALEWLSSDWPDLTDATITLYLRAPDGSKFSKAGTAPVAGSGSQTVRVELTAAETATLIDWPTPSTLRLRAALAVSGRKVTLVTGVLTVAEDIS